MNSCSRVRLQNSGCCLDVKVKASKMKFQCSRHWDVLKLAFLVGVQKERERNEDE